MLIDYGSKIMLCHATTAAAATATVIATKQFVKFNSNHKHTLAHNIMIILVVTSFLRAREKNLQTNCSNELGV